MTISALFSLILIMTSLALLPSTSVALVVTRSAAAGVCQGVWAAAGIVVGDLLFVLVALLGMSALAQALGPLFVAIKYLAAGYLILFGLSLLRPGKPVDAAAPSGQVGQSAGSFLAGLLVTLGDVKAIFFYASLFPALVDVAALQVSDITVLLLITLITVGGVKMGYALAARRVVALTRNLPLARKARPLAGCVLLGAGTFLLAKS